MDYLKSYLIALGFSIDDATYKKFNASVANATKEVTGLGSVTVATATAIGLSVEKVAREFEGLYYASQRTGETVNRLKSYGFAAKQIGISFDQSASALDSFTTAQRLNPGIRAFVGLGGGTGNGPVEQMTNFVEQQKKLYGESGYYVAAMNAELAGIPEATFLQIWNNLPKLRAANAEMKRMRGEAGLSGTKFTEDSVKFTNAWDHLLGALELGKERIASDLIEPTTKAVEVLDGVVQAFNRADVATNGWAGAILGVTSALGGTYAALALVLAIVRRIAAVGAVGAGAAGAGVAGAAEAGGAGVAAGAVGVAGAGIALPLTAAAATIYAAYLGAKKYGPLGVPYDISKKYMDPDASVGAGAFGNQKEKEAFIRASAIKAGINPDIAMAVARSEGFNGFKSSIPGEQSYGAFQLHVTPGGRGHAVGDEFKRLTGLDPSDPANEHESVMFALEWAKRQGWGDFHGAANTGIGRFAGIGDVRLTSGAGGGGDVTVNQTNHNHIVANNAREAGETLDRSNDRANGDLVRNLQGATR